MLTCLRGSSRPRQPCLRCVNERVRVCVQTTHSLLTAANTNLSAYWELLLLEDPGLFAISSVDLHPHARLESDIAVCLTLRSMVRREAGAAEGMAKASDESGGRRRRPRGVK